MITTRTLFCARVDILFTVNVQFTVDELQLVDLFQNTQCEYSWLLCSLIISKMRVCAEKIVDRLFVCCDYELKLKDYTNVLVSI